MRWRPSKLLLSLGLCSVALGGCASLKCAEDAGSFGAASTEPTASSSAGAGLVKQADLPSAKPDANDATSLEQPKANVMEGQLAIARLGERRGENDQAEQAYRELAQRAPRDARPYHRLGVLAVQKGDFVGAMEQFRITRSLAPPTAELLSDIGYCQYLQQQLPEAERTLGEALKLDPNHEGAANNLGLVLGRQGRCQESLRLFKRHNTEAEAYANLAYVLAQNGDSAQAEQMYLRALTLDNSMRAAAQAMLQVNERAQVRSELMPAGPQSFLASPSTSTTGQGPG